MPVLLLKNCHLWLDAALVENIFAGQLHARFVYLPELKTLLVASQTNEVFQKEHKTLWVVLKDRNLHGDKTLPLRDILLDNDLDLEDRTLSYSLDPNGVLTVQL
jgi:hypothetical protein